MGIFISIINIIGIYLYLNNITVFVLIIGAILSIINNNLAVESGAQASYFSLFLYITLGIIISYIFKLDLLFTVLIAICLEVIISNLLGLILIFFIKFKE